MKAPNEHDARRADRVIARANAKASRPDKARALEFRYKPEEIGQDTVDKIIQWYANDLDLTTLVRKLNATAGIAQPINLCDVYTVLMVAYRAGKVKQRRKHLEFELQLAQFSLLYQAWRNELTGPEIMATVDGCRLGKERALKSIQVRHRESSARLKIKEEVVAKNVLGLARAGIHLGQQAFIIYMSEIPPEAIAFFGLDEMIETATLPEPDRDIDPNDAESILMRQAEEHDMLLKMRRESLSTGKIKLPAQPAPPQPHDTLKATPGDTIEVSPLPATTANPHGVPRRHVTSDRDPATPILTPDEFSHTLDAEIAEDAMRIAEEELDKAPPTNPSTAADLFDEDLN
jgi:hypothetical protein